MWRFLLAGLVTVGGLVLLFVASFGDPTPAQAPGQTVRPGGTAAQQAAAALQRQREAIQQQLEELQGSVAKATKDAAALRAQADDARAELDTLRRQREADQTALEQTKRSVQPEAVARPQSVADADQQSAVQQTGAERPKVETQRLDDAGQTTLAARPPVVPPHVELPSETKSLSVPIPATAAPSSPKPGTPTAVKQAQPEPDARETVLARLRRQPVPREETEVGASAEPQFAPSRQRLQAARSALEAGRIDEAERLLEQAQVQLVFRPVGPSQDASVTSSIAAGQVAEALSMLGAGAVRHAINYIDQAMAQTEQRPSVAAAAPPYSDLPQPPGYVDSPGYYYGR